MISIDQHTCPRCLGGIPNDEYRGAYPGALSRTDNRTYICSSCGEHEAIEDFTIGSPLPQATWGVFMSTGEDGYDATDE